MKNVRIEKVQMTMIFVLLDKKLFVGFCFRRIRIVHKRKQVEVQQNSLKNCNNLQRAMRQQRRNVVLNTQQTPND